MARNAKPFRDRNPVTIGAVSLTVIAVLVFLAFNAQSLPLIGGGTVYRAQFPPAATFARLPGCMVRAYARPTGSTFREDSAAARD